MWVVNQELSTRWTGILAPVPADERQARQVMNVSAF